MAGARAGFSLSFPELFVPNADALVLGRPGQVAAWTSHSLTRACRLGDLHEPWPLRRRRKKYTCLDASTYDFCISATCVWYRNCQYWHHDCPAARKRKRKKKYLKAKFLTTAVLAKAIPHYSTFNCDLLFKAKRREISESSALSSARAFKWKLAL